MPAVLTLTPTSQEVLVDTSKAGMDCIETLCDTLELSYQTAVLQVPQVYSLKP